MSRAVVAKNKQTKKQKEKMSLHCAEHGFAAGNVHFARTKKNKKMCRFYPPFVWQRPLTILGGTLFRLFFTQTALHSLLPRDVSVAA